MKRSEVFDDDEGDMRAQDAVTLRDEFALAALQGMLADHKYRRGENETLDEFRRDAAENAYAYADAMLKARQQ